MDFTLLKEKQALEPVSVVKFTSLVDYSVYEFNLNQIISPKEMEELVYETEKLNPVSLGEYDVSNVKAWHSDWYTHLQSEKFNKLIDVIIKACKKIYLTDNELESSELQVRELWTIIYKENDFTKLHSHSLNNKIAISVVYFAHADENATPLKFHVSRGNGETIDFIPKTGHFICFPGFALHSVPKIKENEKRICVAANIALSRVNNDPNVVHKNNPNFKGKINAR